LAKAINSLTELTGVDGCNTRMLGALADNVTAAKSLIGSQGTLLRINGASQNGLLQARSSF
jgi:hypothetical protein